AAGIPKEEFGAADLADEPLDARHVRRCLTREHHVGAEAQPVQELWSSGEQKEYPPPTARPPSACVMGGRAGAVERDVEQWNTRGLEQLQVCARRQRRVRGNDMRLQASAEGDPPQHLGYPAVRRIPNEDIEGAVRPG